MFLTPTELERLTIFTAAELARKRRARGLKLNYPEAVALITDELLEGARDGKSVAVLMGEGSSILTSEDVLPGVAELITFLQIECHFPDGTKLVTVHAPVRPPLPDDDAGESEMERPRQPEKIPGEIIPAAGDIELCPGRPRISLEVTNTGDRPVQIGSHYHFFESNAALEFDRAQSFGMRLDIPAGTAVRFEPGQSRQITLVTFGGTGTLSGLNSLTNGDMTEDGKKQALSRAAARGFKGA